MGGFLDSLFRNAPGIVAKGLAGRQAGIDQREQQTRDEEDRRALYARQALQNMLTQQTVDETQQTGPLRRTLLQSQAEKAQADAEDARAQAAGTGRYAPKLEKAILPEWQREGFPDQASYLTYAHRKAAATHITDPKEPKPPAQPSESERRAGAVLHVLNAANDRVNGVEEGLGKGQLALSRGGMFGRAIQTPEAKQYDDDLKLMVSHYLYVLSGATANPGEVANQAATMRINEADDPATRAIKTTRRRQMVEAVKLMAGRAAEQGGPPARATKYPENPY